MNPKVDLFTTVLLAQVQDVIVPVFGNVKIEQIVSHVQLPAQHYNTFVKFVHFEKDQQMIGVGLFCRMLKVVQNLFAVLFSSGRRLFHHFEVKLDKSMEDSLFIGQFGNLIVEVHQKVFQVIIVGHEKPEILIRLFKCDCSDNL